MTFLGYLLLILNINLPNHRPAISGIDVIVNDINEPYTQANIEEIANIKVMLNDDDITNKLFLFEDEYINNENKVGIFKQTYRITMNHIVGDSKYEHHYDYVLTIYNIDLKVDVTTINVETTINNYLLESDLVKIIEEKLAINVFSIKELSSNYYNDNKEGIFTIEYLITNFTNQQKRVDIVVNVKSVEAKFNTKIIVIICLIVLVAIIILLNILKRRRG